MIRGQSRRELGMVRCRTGPLPVIPAEEFSLRLAAGLKYWPPTVSSMASVCGSTLPDGYGRADQAPVAGVAMGW